MKRTVFSGIPGIAAGFLFVFSVGLLLSCTKPAPAAPKVVIAPLQLLINTDTTLNFFHDMILQGNDAALVGTAPVTLVAPVDPALLAAGYTLAIIDSLPAYIADGFVRYAFISSAITSSPVVNSPYNTALGIPVYLTQDSLSNVYFNGVRAVRDTAAAGNSVVYKLQGLIPTPFDSLQALLAADSNYTLLAEALLQTGLYDSLGTGSFTLLAPDNNAFVNAGYPTITSIDSSNLPALGNLLKYQVVTGLFFTNNLPAVTGLPTLEGETISVGAQNGIPFFTGKNNSSPANLLSGNLLAGSNIVVHKTDQLLQP